MLRWANPDQDAAALGQVFFDAVRTGPSPYTQAQREAWMPHVPEPCKFADRLRAQRVAVAQEQGDAVGFMTLTPDGYIDLAYVLPTHRGRGLFVKLYDKLEAEALLLGIQRLYTHASLMAQPAFHKVGFLIIQHETVERAGECLARAEMEKHLK